MDDVSIYLLKREGMQHRKAIREMIQAGGLAIVKSKLVIVPEWVVRRLYPGLKSGHLQAIIDRLAGIESEIGLVYGDGAIDKLIAVSGDAVDPLKCAEGTIRRRFGVPLRGPWPLYGNVIHRSRDEAEVLRDLQIMGALTQ